MWEARRGGCLCGAVRYELAADPLTLYVCHCTDCQTATGSSFVLSMPVPRDAIVLLQGRPELVEADLADGRKKRGNRCPVCATNVWGAPVRFPQLLNLHPGTLDDTRWLEPVGHIWTRSAQPWLRALLGGLCYEGQPDDMLPLIRAWKARSAG
jgi:hypothetical protein